MYGNSCLLHESSAVSGQELPVNTNPKPITIKLQAIHFVMNLFMVLRWYEEMGALLVSPPQENTCDD